MKADRAQAARLHAFAHDLRNRLIGLHQVLQRLAEDPTSEEKAEYTNYGDQQFFKALREVETLLDDLGVDRGPTEPVRSAVDMAELVRTRVDQLMFRFQRKDQHVALDLEEGQVLSIDARVIGDLLDALLSNASKFSSPGSTVHVTSSTVDRVVSITVRDEGVGLTMADLDMVFVRFAWLESRPTGGESQGRSSLARAREWARVHGGDLFAASAGPGTGCTFTLVLPLDR